MSPRSPRGRSTTRPSRTRPVSPVAFTKAGIATLVPPRRWSIPRHTLTHAGRFILVYESPGYGFLRNRILSLSKSIFPWGHGPGIHPPELRGSGIRGNLLQPVGQIGGKLYRRFHKPEP